VRPLWKIEESRAATIPLFWLLSRAQPGDPMPVGKDAGRIIGMIASQKQYTRNSPGIAIVFEFLCEMNTDSIPPSVGMQPLAPSSCP
jgi:hypothetical protein